MVQKHIEKGFFCYFEQDFFTLHFEDQLILREESMDSEFTTEIINRREGEKISFSDAC